MGGQVLPPSLLACQGVHLPGSTSGARCRGASHDPILSKRRMSDQVLVDPVHCMGDDLYRDYFEEVRVRMEDKTAEQTMQDNLNILSSRMMSLPVWRLLPV